MQSRHPALIFGLFLVATAGFYHVLSGGRWAAWQLRKKPYPKAASTLPVGHLQSTGGQFFFKKVLLPITVVHQKDKSWSGETLAWGPDNHTIGSHGSALTASVMILQHYGIRTDPKALNSLLIRNKGYTAEGWVVWPHIPDIAPGNVRLIYDGPPSYPLIDNNLRQGNPVIVRLAIPDQAKGGNYVVICGKEGLEYLAADPGPRGEKGVTQLKDYGATIDDLQIFEEIVPPRAIPVVPEIRRAE